MDWEVIVGSRSEVTTRGGAHEVHGDVLEFPPHLQDRVLTISGRGMFLPAPAMCHATWCVARTSLFNVVLSGIFEHHQCPGNDTVPNAVRVLLINCRCQSRVRITHLLLLHRSIVLVFCVLLALKRKSVAILPLCSSSDAPYLYQEGYCCGLHCAPNASMRIFFCTM